MKTIEMKVGSKVVQFTTKSVTMDGAEFFYGKMSDIKHSASKHVYAFTYNGETKYLPYDPKYEQALKAIFTQVSSLKKAKAAPAPAAPAPAQEAVPAAENAPAIAKTSAEAQALTEGTALTEAEAPAAPAETGITADETETAVETVATDETAYPVEVSPEIMPASEKKSKLKKSLIVFAAIIVVIGALTAGYFALFGTSSNPSSGPNSTDTQQYDDIDDLIEDLE